MLVGCVMREDDQIDAQLEAVESYRKCMEAVTSRSVRDLNGVV
jgi:hypothetical protein